MCKHLTSRSNWNLEMLVFMEGGKPEYPEKNSRSKDENQQQTQPTYDTGTGGRSRAILVEGECSHHYAIPASPKCHRKRSFSGLHSPGRLHFTVLWVVNQANHTRKYLDCKRENITSSIYFSHLHGHTSNPSDVVLHFHNDAFFVSFVFRFVV